MSYRRSLSPSPRRFSRSPSPRYRKYSRSPSPRYVRGRYSRSPSPRYRRRSPPGGRYPRRSSPRGPIGSERERRGSSSLFVGNLPYSFRERDVAECFDRCGPLRNVTVGFNKRTGQSKGYAFVEFEDRRDAEEAYERFNGYNIEGRRLRLDWDLGIEKKMMFSAPRRRSPYRRSSHSPPPRRRSISPLRKSRSPSPRGRSPSPRPIQSPRKRSRTPSPRKSPRMSPFGDGLGGRKRSRSPVDGTSSGAGLEKRFRADE